MRRPRPLCFDRDAPNFASVASRKNAANSSRNMCAGVCEIVLEAAPLTHHRRIGACGRSRVLLRRAQLGRDAVNDADGVVQMSVGYEDLEERVVSYRARRLVLGQEQLLMDRGHTAMTAPHVTPPARGGSGGSNGFQGAEQKLDLRPYINTSAVSIQSTFSVYRTYILFRTLGLRHLTVVDELNRVVGLVTRKEMLGFALDKKLGG